MAIHLHRHQTLRFHTQITFELINSYKFKHGKQILREIRTWQHYLSSYLEETKCALQLLAAMKKSLLPVLL